MATTTHTDKADSMAPRRDSGTDALLTLARLLARVAAADVLHGSNSENVVETNNAQDRTD